MDQDELNTHRLFSHYGGVTEEVAKYLIRKGQGTLYQISSSLKISSKRSSLALAMLLQFRHIRYFKIKTRVVYTMVTEYRRPLFCLYCEYVEKRFGEDVALVFKQILIRGVVNIGRIKNKETVDILKLNGIVDLVSQFEVKSAVYEVKAKETNNKKAPIKMKEMVNNTKKIKTNEHEKRKYLVIAFEGVEKHMFSSKFTDYLVFRYNPIVANIFDEICRLRAVTVDILYKKVKEWDVDRVEFDNYLNYLISENIIFVSTSGSITKSNEWMEILKRKTCSNYVYSHAGRISRRIFNIILKNKLVEDRAISALSLVDNSNARMNLVELQRMGYVNEFGNFSSSIFYSKTIINWGVDINCVCNILKAELFNNLVKLFCETRVENFSSEKIDEFIDVTNEFFILTQKCLI